MNALDLSNVPVLNMGQQPSQTSAAEPGAESAPPRFVELSPEVGRDLLNWVQGDGGFRISPRDQSRFDADDFIDEHTRNLGGLTLENAAAIPRHPTAEMYEGVRRRLGELGVTQQEDSDELEKRWEDLYRQRTSAGRLVWHTQQHLREGKDFADYFLGGIDWANNLSLVYRRAATPLAMLTSTIGYAHRKAVQNAFEAIRDGHAGEAEFDLAGRVMAGVEREAGKDTAQKIGEMILDIGAFSGSFGGARDLARGLTLRQGGAPFVLNAERYLADRTIRAAGALPSLGRRALAAGVSEIPTAAATTAVNLPGILGRAAEMNTPQARVGQNGGLETSDRPNRGMAWMQAAGGLPAAFVDNFIENYTEIAGGRAINYLGVQPISRAMQRLGNVERVRALGASLGALAQRVPGSGGVGRVFEALRRRGQNLPGFNGILSEIGEERLGDLMRGWAQLGDYGPLAQLGGPKAAEALEQLGMEALAFVGFGAANKGGGALGQAWRGRSGTAQTLQEAQQALLQRGASRSQVSQWVEQVHQQLADVHNWNDFDRTFNDKEDPLRPYAREVARELFDSRDQTQREASGQAQRAEQARVDPEGYERRLAGEQSDARVEQARQDNQKGIGELRDLIDREIARLRQNLRDDRATDLQGIGIGGRPGAERVPGSMPALRSETPAIAAAADTPAAETVQTSALGDVEKGLRRKGFNVEFIRNKVQQLGSAAAVQEVYNDDGAVSRYANALAKELFGGNPGVPGTREKPPRMVRFYHGGANDGGGPRWFSPDIEYARGYARKSRGGSVSYIDLPEGHPLLQKAYDDTGTNMPAPYISFEAPEEIAKLRKPIALPAEPKEKAPATSDLQQLGKALRGQGFDVKGLQDRVRTLGNAAAVAKGYGGESLVDRYARAFAEKIFGEADAEAPAAAAKPAKKVKASPKVVEQVQKAIARSEDGTLEIGRLLEGVNKVRKKKALKEYSAEEFASMMADMEAKGLVSKQDFAGGTYYVANEEASRAEIEREAKKIREGWSPEEAARRKGEAADKAKALVRGESDPDEVRRAFLDRMAERDADRARMAEVRSKKPPTLLSYVKRLGGLSKETMAHHGMNVRLMEEAIPSIFKDADGKKGTRDVSEVVTELVNEGHLLPVPEKRHPHDWLWEKLQENALSLQADLERQLAREQEQFYKEQANARRSGFSAEAVAKSAAQGTEDSGPREEDRGAEEVSGGAAAERSPSANEGVQQADDRAAGDAAELTPGDAYEGPVEGQAGEQPDDFTVFNKLRTPAESRPLPPKAGVAVAEKDTLSKHQIVATMSEQFGVPVRPDHLRGRAAALYRVGPRTIRADINYFGDVLSMAHEVGHDLDTKHKISQQAPAAVQDSLRTLDYEPNRKDRDVARMEGFAELVRVWWTEDPNKPIPAELRTWFDGWLAAHPQIKQKFERVKALIDTYRSMTPTQRTMAEIRSGDRQAAKAVRTKSELANTWAASAWDKWLHNIVGEGHYLKKGQELIEKLSGTKFEEGQGPYGLYLALSKEAPTFAINAFKDGPMLLSSYEQIAGVEGPAALVDKLKLTPQDLEKAVAFGFARHALEEWEGGRNPGITKEDAEATMRDLADPRFKAFADGLTAYNNALLKVLADAGVITPAEADYHIETMKNYLPLWRVRPAGSASRPMHGTRFVDGGKFLKRRSGADLQVMNPLEATMARTFLVYQKAARQMVVNELLKHKDLPGIGELIEREKPAMRPVRVELKTILNKLAKEGLLDDIGIDLKEVLKGIDADDRDRTLPMTEEDPLALPTGMNFKVQKEGRSIHLSIEENGEEIGYIDVADDRMLANASRNLYQGRVADGEQVWRVHGIEVNDDRQGQGLGQKLYLKALSLIGPGNWLGNSQQEPGAVRATNALATKELLEIHRRGGPGGHWIGRMADQIVRGEAIDEDEYAPTIRGQAFSEEELTEADAIGWGDVAAKIRDAGDQARQLETTKVVESLRELVSNPDAHNDHVFRQIRTELKKLSRDRDYRGMADIAWALGLKRALLNKTAVMNWLQRRLERSYLKSVRDQSYESYAEDLTSKDLPTHLLFGTVKRLQMLANTRPKPSERGEWQAARDVLVDFASEVKRIEADWKREANEADREAAAAEQAQRASQAEEMVEEALRGRRFLQASLVQKDSVIGGKPVSTWRIEPSYDANFDPERLSHSTYFSEGDAQRALDKLEAKFTKVRTQHKLDQSIDRGNEHGQREAGEGRDQSKLTFEDLAAVASRDDTSVPRSEGQWDIAAAAKMPLMREVMEAPLVAINKGVDSYERRREYGRALLIVFSQMSASGRQAVIDSGVAWDFYNSAPELMANYKRASDSRGWNVEGPKQGQLWGGVVTIDSTGFAKGISLDGGRDLHGSGLHRHNVAEIYAHELGHVLDFMARRGKEAASLQNGWIEAQQHEISAEKSRTRRPLSSYATTRLEEGFAEFARVLYSGSYDLKHIRDNFPKAWAYFDSLGYLPDGMGSGKATTPREVFSKRVDLPDGHADVLKSQSQPMEDLPATSLADFITVFVPDFQNKSDQPIVRVLENGAPAMYRLDPQLYSFMKGMEFQAWEGLGKAVPGVMRWFKFFTTGANPGFAAKNFFRDWQTFFFQAQHVDPLTRAVGPPVEMAKRILSGTWGFFAAMAGHEKLESEMEKLFQLVGGEFMHHSGRELRDQRSNLDALVWDKHENFLLNPWRLWRGQSLLGGFAKGIRRAADFMQGVVGVAETVPRYLEFKAVLQNEGYDEERIKELAKQGKRPPAELLRKAKIAAAEVTINFQEQGAVTKNWNQVLPYLSAHVRGNARFLRNLREMPAGVQAVRWSAYLGLITALWLMVKDDDWWQEMAPDLKYTHLFIPVREGSGWRIPLTHGHGHWIGANYLALLEAVRTKASQPVRDAFMQAAADLVSPAQRGPVLLTPMVEALTNYDLRRDRPLENESVRRLPAGERAYASTTPASRAIGGAAGVSPIKLDHVLDSMTGRLYSAAFNLDWPRLFGYGGLQTRSEHSQAVQDLYREVTDVAQREASLRVSGRAVPQQLGDRNHLLDRAKDLMAALQTPIRNEQDPEKRLAYDRYRIGLARAILGRSELARYPNPLRPSNWAGMPDQARQAVQRALGVQAEHATDTPPAIERGETPQHFQERRRRFEDEQRRARSILSLAGVSGDDARRLILDRARQRQQPLNLTPGLQNRLRRAGQ